MSASIQVNLCIVQRILENTHTLLQTHTHTHTQITFVTHLQADVPIVREPCLRHQFVFPVFMLCSIISYLHKNEKLNTADSIHYT